MAKFLQDAEPETFYRIIETSTRKIRNNEKNGIDYNFVSDDEYDKLKDDMFQTVEYQFSPDRYGSLKSDNKKNKWNIIVASIEGFLAGIANQHFNDDSILLNILNDTVLDIERDGRNPQNEENINRGILKSFMTPDKTRLLICNHSIIYNEINLSYLKTIRNSKEELLDYINKIMES